MSDLRDLFREPLTAIRHESGGDGPPGTLPVAAQPLAPPLSWARAARRGERFGTAARPDPYLSPDEARFIQAKRRAGHGEAAIARMLGCSVDRLSLEVRPDPHAAAQALRQAARQRTRERIRAERDTTVWRAPGFEPGRARSRSKPRPQSKTGSKPRPEHA